MILETRRLSLRYFLPEDLDPLWTLYSDPEMVRFIPDAPRTREEALAEVEWFRRGHPTFPELGLWATIHRESGRLIGRCGLLPWMIDGRREVEIAYLIDRRCQGQGLATEAAEAIRDYAVERLGLTRLVCLIDPENHPSRRVAEKIGMQFETEGVDDKGPFHLYSMQRTGPIEAHR